MYVCEFFYSYNYTHVFIVLIIQILNVLFWLLQRYRSRSAIVSNIQKARSNDHIKFFLLNYNRNSYNKFKSL